MRPQKIRLGEILISHGLIGPEELQTFLTQSKQTGKRLGQVLIQSGRVREEDLSRAVADQLQVPFIDLRTVNPSPELVQAIGESQARRWACLVLDRRPDGGFRVAMSDPADVFAYDEISKHLNAEIDVVAATETAIFASIDRLYRKTGEISELAGELSREFSVDAVDFTLIPSASSEDAPVVRLLQTIFEDAIASRASDIHIEPMERKLLIRFRIDGSLHLQNEADPKIAAPLTQRLKLISGLNISERRLPQDGRFNIKVHRSVIDVRIATAPTAFGESVVMRILNQNAGLLSLERLAMPAPILGALKSALERPHGMILVTGPTGSGKTTTLYGALNFLNRSDTKIITVEDPVEYRIEGINQIQAFEKIGLTFHTALRSILRQDPDVILIGEMRDRETVESALRASMTGHLVLSTLHTNDAKSAPSRLMDMGAEKFMVGSSLNLVLAQRLVKLTCEQCKTPYQPDETELSWLETMKLPLTGSFFRGAGCPQCSGTGHLGRTGVYEMLIMDHDLSAALYDKNTREFMDLASHKIGDRTLARHAASLALSGHITIAEARRISVE